LPGSSSGCDDNELLPAVATVGDGASASPTPLLGAAGIGVEDLDASLDFYTKVLGMRLRYELTRTNSVSEKTLYFPGSEPASDVVLMNYLDGEPHDYADNPVKLVFYVPDAAKTIDAIRRHGLRIISEPAPQPAFDDVIVGLGTDPDGYILEIIEQPTLNVPHLGAIGIGVADLEESKEFYTRVLGMRAVGDLIRVAGVWDEWILHYETPSSAIVLMHWTDGSSRDYANNPLKTVHYVADAAALTRRVAAEGLQILSQPMLFNLQGIEALIGVARDPDGYVLEIATTR
jgi:catechol 2,3-dioxygenase-like lactoylglutathione lyase family enzyme